MNHHSSKGLGVLALIGVLALFFVARHSFSAIPTALLVIAGVMGLGIIILVAVVMYFAFRKPQSKNGEAAGDAPAAILAKGRSHLLELTQLSMRIQNQQVRRASEGVCGVIGQILSALKEQPEELPRVRKLFNYYLPAFGKILQQFRRLEQSGVPASDTTEKVISCFGDIQAAMEKLYASLFDGSKLDLTIEIETLRQFCKQDGLLADSHLYPGDSDQDITLTI